MSLNLLQNVRFNINSNLGLRTKNGYNVINAFNEVIISVHDFLIKKKIYIKKFKLNNKSVKTRSVRVTEKKKKKLSIRKV